ncbi:kinetochore-associated Ndc80 complex subunit spc25 [Basidiobolus ranarum]|uniref:Kinetochore protein SPC25 n=1 Tax=Basidiobolus ranarum TaxID=34480 RepID=A0ABR2VLE0_9FUNG
MLGQTNFVTTNSDLSLPNVNFAADGLRTSLQTFLKQFDTFIKNGKEEILSKRQDWLKNLTELNETSNKLKSETEYYQSEETNLSKNLDKEKRRIAELKTDLANLQKNNKDSKSKEESLLQQIRLVREEIRKKKQERAIQVQALQSQQVLNEPELNFYEEKLALSIIGDEEDRITFLFTNIDANNHSREFKFTMDVSQRTYKVPVCQPMVESLNSLLDSLNENRDFYTFVKKMRQAFVECVRN